MPQDMTCVYHAASIGEADIVVAWLHEQGIPRARQGPLRRDNAAIAADRGAAGR